MRKPLLVVIWLVATIATTAVAYVAVNAAGAEVTDRPLTSIVATGDTGAPSNSSTTGQTSTSLAPTTSGPFSSSTSSTTTRPATTAGTTGTSGPGSTSTSSTASTTITTSTPTSSTATTATTASDAPWQQTTIPSKGGLVIVSYRPEEVKLESVAPAAGFTYEIHDQGPSEVRVRFEGGDVKVEVRVRWDDQLVIEVDEDA